MDLTMVENRSVKQYTAARLGVILTAAVITVFLTCITTQEAHASAEWYRFQNSMENNGVTDVEMPGSYNEAALKWGRSMVLGYTTSFTPPLIINGDHISGIYGRAAAGTASGTAAGITAGTASGTAAG